MGKTKDVSEQSMVVDAKRTGLWQELQRCWVFHAQPFPRVYKEWTTTQRTSSQLDTTVGSIGFNMEQRPCGTLSTPYIVHAPANCAVLRAKGGATQY
jgi:hypothetical protein